ncbi:MAG: bifunctional (p)ppGpp synthetase/guanosine-3',5'-bis(diphosphate) 3'-pyrophosphohydrolase [Proteobacteria bacterium]|nr:bifunctional (p)ppGpp synthetase/guanosine-3',5'-bis(diphosphate) 3'-pyrophosphohydrolase [Pseudomonadota bacterium]
MLESELLFKDLTSYLKADDVSRLQRAYAFSEAAHHGQFRKSGEPYISHPLAVAKILAQWHLDPQALTAALLHDVMEDTAVTKEEIAESFGKPVAELVDGVSKIDAIEFQSKEDFQAENFRKMLLAMARDVRVILIKLADRLHNMRTMQVMDPARKKRIARETLDIYAPIANRLGLNSIYQELEDLSFRYLHPTRYRVLSKALKTSRGNRREVVGKVLDAILARLKEGGIDAAVTGREKHLHSIYNKMLEKQLSFAQVQDIYGFRVIVKDVPSCYVTLGILHGLYKPFPGKFKDYIAIPKANGYQSLHTTLFGPFGMPLEVQIRTHEMHKIAEAGVASHWLYKTSDADLNELHQKTHQWLQSLLELQTTSGTAVEFLEHLKVDLFPDEVYVFTPKGKIMALPRGATAVDFAYFVHTDIGNRAIAVKINDELMPLRTELKNGDRVDIIIAVQARPNPAWLNFVATARARSQIRHFLKTMQLEESVLLGERLLNQALATLKGTPAEIGADSWDKYLREPGAKSKSELHADIGLGKRLAAVVAAPGTILIRGTEGMAAQLARCCNPIPGDPVIGLVSKGQGIVIHTQDCPVIRKSRHESDRWVDVQWDDKTRRTFLVNIRLSVANERGVLARVAGGIAEAGSNIDNVSVEQSDSSAYSTMNFTLQVTNRFHLAQIMKRLRLIPEVARIVRVKGQPRERDQ